MKSLWLEEDNKFHKAFRILSSQYLRKHSLHHIFNSRVNNHALHLKYVRKLIKSIEDPEQFITLKLK
jgi:hypothetical protein